MRGRVRAVILGGALGACDGGGCGAPEVVVDASALQARSHGPQLGDGRWFTLAATLSTTAPATDRMGHPIAGKMEDRGGEAIAVFDVDRDGRQDVVIANGSDYFFVAHNEPDATRGVRFTTKAILDGKPDDDLSHRAKGLGLHDLDNDGWMDLWLANQGKGGVVTYKRDMTKPPGSPLGPNDKGLYRSANLSTWFNREGVFRPEPYGLNAGGSKRTILFDDFDRDGWTDAWVSVSTYFGVWYAGGTEPNQLLPGRKGFRFDPDALRSAFVDEEASFWVDEQGRSHKNFKGAIARDLDGDGRAEIITGSIADLWANWELDLTDPAEDGYQGTWERGLYIFHNRSKPGALRFEDVSHQALAMSHGVEGQGHVHSVLAVDIDHDGDFDLIVSGNKGMLSHNTLTYDSPIFRVLRNDSTRGQIRLVDVTADAGLAFLNGQDQLPAPYPLTVTQFGVTQTLFPAMMAGAPIDFNNDGHVDLIMVDRQTFSDDPQSGEPLGLGAFVFLGDGRGGFRFVPVEEHGLTGTARDVSVGDFDADGRMDLVFVDGSTGGQFTSDTNRVWLNQSGAGNHWLWVTVDEANNRFGIGAAVQVEKEGRILGYDEVRTDFNYRSKRDAAVHLGLGEVTQVRLLVRFRDGVWARIPGVRADQRVRVVRYRAPEVGGRTCALADGRVAEGWVGLGGPDRLKVRVEDCDGDGDDDLVVPAEGAVLQGGGVYLVVTPARRAAAAVAEEP
jgi:hypothetical protein